MTSHPTAHTISGTYDAARWLHGFYLIAHTIESAVKDPFGLTVSQYEFLLFLEDNPASRLTDVCKTLPVKPNTVSLIASQLVKRKFVDKQRDDEDNRAFRLTLTEKGRRALEETSATLMEELRRQWRLLTLEQAQTVSLLSDPFHAARPRLKYLLDINVLSRAIDDALAPAGITLTQTLVLAETSGATGGAAGGNQTDGNRTEDNRADGNRTENGIRPVQIERSLDVRSNTLAAAVRALEAKGYLDARRQGSRAGTFLVATDAGLAQLDVALGAVTGPLDALLSELYDPETLAALFISNDAMMGHA